MGWLDDLKKGFDSGFAQQSERERRTTDRLYEQKAREDAERQRLENLRYESDKVLFDKYNSIFTSSEEKAFIKEILLSRGYSINSNGTFNR